MNVSVVTLLFALLGSVLGLYFLTTELMAPSQSWWMVIASCLMIVSGIGQLWRDIARPWLSRRIERK